MKKEGIMGLFDRFKYKKTDFKAGGLILADKPLGAKEGLQADPEFVAPRKIDRRDMLLASSNQGNFPHCVGFGTAGILEYWHWKKKHYPIQYNGDKIYEAAKKIDNYNGPGTYLRFGIQGAIDLGLINGKKKQLGLSVNNVKYAIHEHDIVLAGFNITDEWNLVDKSGRIVEKANPKNIGGHCVIICGFNKDGFYIQNSWDESWGLHGFCLLPYALFKKQFMSGYVIKDIQILG